MEEGYQELEFEDVRGPERVTPQYDCSLSE
jgi:hypothetical protein